MPTEYSVLSDSISSDVLLEVQEENSAWHGIVPLSLLDKIRACIPELSTTGSICTEHCLTA